MSRSRSRLGAAVFLALFAVGSAALKTELLGIAGRPSGVQRGQAAPEFELPDTTGNTVSLHATAREKKVVLLNFWATWCVPCRLEMPQLQQLHERHG